MIDFRYLTFLKLCEIMNYTKTAEALYITQPTVTHHIQYLENIYGCKLFQLKGKKLFITKKGEKLLAYVNQMIANSLQIEKEIKNSNNSQTITFGATLSIGEFVMPKTLIKFINNGIKFNMIVENTQNLLLKLEKGEIDFAMIEGFFDKSKYHYRLFREEDFVGICAKNSSLAGRVHRIEDLFHIPLILREKGSGSRDIFKKSLYEKNITLESFKTIIEVGNINVIKKLVKEDYGISFMYRCAVENSLDIIQIQGFNIKREFNLVYLKNHINEEEFLYYFHHYIANQV